MNNQLVISNPNKELFIQNIKQWVYFDTKIQQFNENIRLAKIGKDQASGFIEHYFLENPSLKDCVEISNGKVRMREKKEYQNLTFIYVNDTLQKMIQNKDVVEKIMQALKENREIKVTKEIKRTNNKELE